MGFRSILDIFRSDNWSAELIEMINKMLALGAEMYEYAADVVVNGAEDTDPQKRIYDRDKKINKLERKIRRRVVSRLSVAGNANEVPSALIFMNVIKDAERVGDYAKNLHEISGLMPEAPDRALYQQVLGGPAAEITDVIAKTRRAFADSDEELAGQVIKKAKAEGRSYEEAIREITVSDLPTKDAVCLVLSLRFFKRFVAHMGNIATAVVMPVDMLDFYDESEL